MNQNSANILKQSLTPSKFNMWRASFAVVYLDQKVAPEEQKWIDSKLKLIPFDKEQRKILDADLKGTFNFDDIVAGITDKKDLAFLLYQIRVISNLDLDFSAQEKKAYGKVEKQIMSGLDMAKLEEQAETMEKESYNESEVYKVHNKASLLEAVHMKFLKFLNPGDYKFPK